MLFLPPYSPDFNPIEMAFFKLKIVSRFDFRSPLARAHRPEAFAKKSRSTSNYSILACNFSISASLAALAT